VAAVAAVAAVAVVSVLPLVVPVLVLLVPAQANASVAAQRQAALVERLLPEQVLLVVRVAPRDHPSVVLAAVLAAVLAVVLAAGLAAVLAAGLAAVAGGLVIQSSPLV